MAIFQYDFMVRAFIIGLFLAAIIPCIGVTVVLKRLSMMGDALSHTSLAGVATGLAFGWNPVAGAMVFCVIAALGVEEIRKRVPQYAEISIAIVMSAGIGIAGVMSGFVQSSAGFSSFLFGSIVAVTDFELVLVMGISVVVFLTTTLLYREIFFMTFDEQGAKMAGIPVERLNGVIAMITALTISIASRTIGVLIVSSLMVIPAACAMQLAKSYKQTMILSSMFGVIFTTTGLFIAFYGNVKPGGATVLIGVLAFVLILLWKNKVPAKRRSSTAGMQEDERIICPPSCR